MSYTTSAIYTVWEVLLARMQTISFPTRPIEGVDAPYVWFGDPSQPNADESGNPPEATERVVVCSEVESPDVEWGPLGQYAREEKWLTRIYVETAIPGRTAAQAQARLEELTAAIEADVRAQFQASRPGATFPAALAPWAPWAIAVERIQPKVMTANAGYVAAADVFIGCAFRINRTANI